MSRRTVKKDFRENNLLCGECRDQFPAPGPQGLKEERRNKSGDAAALYPIVCTIYIYEKPVDKLPIRCLPIPRLEAGLN
jgi:hypothetical protein